VAARPCRYFGLASRRILGETIETKYTFPTDTGKVTGTLMDVLELEGETEREREETALRRFRNMITTNLDRPSGVVTFEVETYNPALSAQIAQRLLDFLNRILRGLLALVAGALLGHCSPSS
jgi:hypothetical protein